MFQWYLLEFCWGIIFQVGNTIKLMFFKGNICSGFRSNGCWLRSNLSFSWICLKLSSSEIHSTDTLFCTPGLLFSGTQTAAYFVQFDDFPKTSGLVGSSSHAVSICAMYPNPRMQVWISEDDALFEFFGVIFFYGFKSHGKYITIVHSPPFGRIKHRFQANTSVQVSFGALKKKYDLDLPPRTMWMQSSPPRMTSLHF